jgi:hypothetical protein
LIFEKVAVQIKSLTSNEEGKKKVHLVIEDDGTDNGHVETKLDDVILELIQHVFD